MEGRVDKEDKDRELVFDFKEDEEWDKVNFST